MSSRGQGKLTKSRMCSRFAAGVVVAVATCSAPAQAADSGVLNPAVLNSTDGQVIYQEICQGCHMSAAGGAEGAGHYPALAKDPALASRDYMALTLLMGRRNMPAFGARHAIGFGGPPAVLSEEQIAAVVNYVRTHFGNHYTDRITAAEVHDLDQQTH